MAVTYVRNSQTGEFELVGPGGATTDTTLSLSGKPADAAAVGNALADYVTAPELNYLLNYKSNTDHIHTATEIGALPYIDARGEEYDMGAILASGTHYNAYRFNNTTLDTPYTQGLCSYSSGLIISGAVASGSGKQVAYVNGEDCTFERTMKNSVVGEWYKVYNSKSKPSLAELGVQSGKVTVSCTANTVSKADVTFAKTYTSTPIVTLTAGSSVPGTVSEVTVSNVTTTGFTACVYRTNDTSTVVHWIAVGDVD